MALGRRVKKQEKNISKNKVANIREECYNIGQDSFCDRVSCN